MEDGTDAPTSALQRKAEALRQRRASYLPVWTDVAGRLERYEIGHATAEGLLVEDGGMTPDQARSYVDSILKTRWHGQWEGAK